MAQTRCPAQSRDVRNLLVKFQPRCIATRRDGGWSDALLQRTRVIRLRRIAPAAFRYSIDGNAPLSMAAASSSASMAPSALVSSRPVAAHLRRAQSWPARRLKGGGIGPTGLQRQPEAGQKCAGWWASDRPSDNAAPDNRAVPAPPAPRHCAAPARRRHQARRRPKTPRATMTTAPSPKAQSIQVGR